MANISLLSPQVIAHELLRLTGQEIYGGGLQAGIFAETGGHGLRLGDTVRIRRVQPFSAPRSFDDLAGMMQVTADSVTLNEQARVEYDSPANALILSLDDYSRQYLWAAVGKLAAQLREKWPPGCTLVTGSLQAVNLQGVASHTASDPDLGLSLRLIHQFDPVNDLYMVRADILFGFLGQPAYQMTAWEAELVAMLTEARDYYADVLAKAA